MKKQILIASMTLFILKKIGKAYAYEFTRHTVKLVSFQVMFASIDIWIWTIFKPKNAAQN